MKKIILYLLIFYIKSGLFAFDGFTFLASYNFEIYKCNTKKINEISLESAIFNYGLSGDKLYILTSSQKGTGQWESDPTIQLFYTYIFKDDFDNLIFNEIHTNNSAYGISLSPDKSMLLIKETDVNVNYNYEFIRVENDSIFKVEKLNNYQVLDWLTSNILLVEKEKNLFSFNLSEQVFSPFKNSLDLENGNIISFKSVSQKTIFFFKDDKQRLIYNYNNNSSEIYSSDSDRLYYTIINDNKLILLEKNIINDKINYELMKINFEGKVLQKVNLTNIFNNKSFYQVMAMSENIKENYVTIFSYDLEGSISFYKFNVKDMKSSELLIQKSFLDVRMIRMF